MEILKIKIEDLLKFPFKEKDWINTFGLYTLISFIFTMLIVAFLTLMAFGGIAALEATLEFAAFPLLLLALISIPTTLFFFIIQLYLQGYMLEIIRNIKEGKNATLPRHNEISAKIKSGFQYFLLGIVPLIIALILIIISLAIFLIGISLIEKALLIGLVLIILGVLLITISTFLTISITVIVLPAMLYIFLTTKSIKEAYEIKTIKLVIKSAWKEFLVIYAISILTSMIISTISQIPGFGLIIISFGMAYTTFLIAFVTGKVFNDLDKLSLLK